MLLILKRHARRWLAAASLLAVAALSLLAGPAGAQIASRDALVAALDSAARAHAAHDDVAGVSVAVVRGGDTLLMRGYGFADLEWSVATPPDASATYEIGSVTKQFTAAAALKLVEEGKLDLDAPITRYLPDYDTHGHDISLRRLLDHTSGIKGYTEMPAFWETLAKERLPRERLLAMFQAEPLEFEPGTAQSYSNSALFLVGLIIEEVSGRSYQDFVRERLFEPLGMKDSYYCSETALRARRAHGYDMGEDGFVQKGYLDHTWPYAAGSLCSSAGDLVRWTLALHGGQVLAPASYRAMTTPVPLLDGTPLEYGMGLGVGERAGRRVLAHGGGINGFLTDSRYFPEDSLIVVVLQNSAGPRNPAALGDTFARLVLGPIPAPVAQPYTGDLDALLGEYAGPVRGAHLHLTVARDGDQLVLTRSDREAPIRPLHLGDGVWLDRGTRYSFEVAGGRAHSARLAGGSARTVLRRMP